MSDLLRVALPGSLPAGTPPRGVVLRPVVPEDAEDLAAAYLQAYPPGVGAGDAAAARAELDETFAGAFGVLVPAASPVAVIDGRAAGALLTVERSIWDPELEASFVIDFFLVPSARGRGLGRAMLRAGMRACAARGDRTLALRTGSGTSAAALALYREAGFVDRADSSA